jgi:hypothetical protein
MRDSISETVYTVVYDSKKPNPKNLSSLEPFIKRNIIYVGESPVQDTTKYPNGLYLVYDGCDKKKWLYFVHPTEKLCGKQIVILADHLSFCYDKSDTKNACHFHSTVYECTTDETFGQKHIKDFFPDTLILPDQEDTIITNPEHIEKRHVILDIIKYHAKSGGGRKKKQNKPKTTPEKARPVTNVDFCRWWDTNAIKNMTAFGFRNGNKITFTIKLIQGRMYNNRTYKAFSFTCKATDDYEALLQQFMSMQITKNNTS